MWACASIDALQEKSWEKGEQFPTAAHPHFPVLISSCHHFLEGDPHRHPVCPSHNKWDRPHHTSSAMENFNKGHSFQHSERRIVL